MMLPCSVGVTDWLGKDFRHELLCNAHKYCLLNGVPNTPTASSVQRSRRTNTITKHAIIRNFMFFIFLMANSYMKPVPSSGAAAATKSDRVQCTSSVNRIAMNGMHYSSADVSMMIKSLFFCKIKMLLSNRAAGLTSVIYLFYRSYDIMLSMFKSNVGAKSNLHFKRATESPGCIVRLCAVVIYEDVAIPIHRQRSHHHVF